MDGKWKENSDVRKEEQQNDTEEEMRKASASPLGCEGQRGLLE